VFVQFIRYFGSKCGKARYSVQQECEYLFHHFYCKANIIALETAVFVQIDELLKTYFFGFFLLLSVEGES